MREQKHIPRCAWVLGFMDAGQGLLELGLGRVGGSCQGCWGGGWGTDRQRIQPSSGAAVSRGCLFASSVFFDSSSDRLPTVGWDGMR